MLQDGSLGNAKEQDSILAKYVYDPRLREILAARGMEELLPVQKAAIEENLFYRQSLLICAPSGSGKTLIGELAAMGAILNRLGKAAYLVPYRALAAQKAREFTKYYDPYGVHVVVAMGEDDIPDAELATADLLVTTFEKLDAMLRNSKMQQWVMQLSVVVADEIHEIGEPNRGPRLESLLVRLFQRVRHIQVVALSATIGNPAALTEWLGTLGAPVHLVMSEVRPVPLRYEIAVNPRKDRYIHTLSKDTLASGGQLLVFVAKRKDAESQAIKLAAIGDKFLTPADREKIDATLARLDRVRGRTPILETALRAGVGFHHAGLGKQERRAVEYLYNIRAIKIVACTTTLAAGINTPARVVVLRSVEQSKKLRKSVERLGEAVLPPPWLEHFSYLYAFIPFSPNQVFQLLGRAGRPGYDTMGHGIILCGSDPQAAWAQDYYFRRESRITPAGVSETNLAPKYSNLQSQLADPEALREQVLLYIFEHGGATGAAICTYLERTFYAFLRKKDVDPLRVDTLLRVKPLSTSELIALYGTNSGEVLITVISCQVDGSRINAVVATSNSVFHSYFDATAGPGCSCSAQGGWMATVSGKKELCPHLSSVLRYVSACATLPNAAILADIIGRSLKEESILAFLLTHGFIRIELEESKEQVFRATGFGEITTHLYVPPSLALKVRSTLHGDQPVSQRTTLQLGMEMSNPRGIPGNDIGIVEMWIDEVPLEEIVAKNHTSLGDVNATTSAVARNLSIAATFAEFFNRPSVTYEMQLLALRVRHGVREDVLDLAARVPGVGRVRARSLARAGFNTPRAVAETTVENLTSATGMTRGVLEPIHEACLTLATPPINANQCSKPP